MHTPWKPYDNRVFAEIEHFQTNLQEVKKLIHEIDCSKSSAIENVSTRMLKIAFSHAPQRLVKIFNLSFNSGMIPPFWKLSKVTPIPKSGNKRLINNYRPISLIPLPCKLIEKIVHNRVYGFLSREKVLTDCQGGFRPGHSTLDTLAKFTDDVLRGINVGKDTVSTFIDLRKAFDTVDHGILLE